jgi:hypothetical protein
VMLVSDKPIKLTKGDLVNGLINRGKKHLKIQDIVVKRMGRVVSALSRRSKALDRRGAGPHRLPLRERLTFCQPLQRTIILVACGGIIALRVAPRHADGPMSQELLHHR